MAERNLLKGATDILPAGNGKRSPEQNRRNQARLNRLALDLFANEFRQYERSLRVSNQHNAASIVIVLEIIVPRIPHIVVGEAAVQSKAGFATGKSGTKSEQRDLPIEWCVQA